MVYDMTYKDKLIFKELTILDLLLKKIKRIHDDISYKKNKEETNVLKKIHACIKKQKRASQIDSSEVNVKKLEREKEKLKDFYDTKKTAYEAKIEEFNILRDGEVNAKLFTEIKEKRFSKNIRKIEFEDGQEFYENKHIAETLTNHYKKCVENKKELGED